MTSGFSVSEGPSQNSQRESSEIMLWATPRGEMSKDREEICLDNKYMNIF